MSATRSKHIFHTGFLSSVFLRKKTLEDGFKFSFEFCVKLNGELALMLLQL